MHFRKKFDVQAHTRGILLIFLFVSFVFGVNPLHASAQSASGCPAGKKCVFVPIVLAPPAGDLVINGIEITQAVQDLDNSVPLVAGRSTILRVYAKTTGLPQPMSNVKVSVSASASTNLLSGSPFAYAATVPLTYDRSSLSTTINVALPQNWTMGDVDITVRLDPENNIPEQNEDNNSLTRRFVFQQVPELNVKIVPIRYVNTNDKYTYPAPTRDSISDWILRTYPVSRVNISWREAYTFTGNLSTSSDFSRLLSEVTALKSTDSAPPSQVYYALVPTTDGARNWFFGGIAGIGWVGSRTSAGLDVTGSAGQIAAHEIGHNFGMLHTPCGYPASPDPNYPYPDGSIGQMGMDVFNGKLYASTSKDLMSYCTPKWISDYTYKILFNAQRQSGSAAFSLMATSPAERGLLFRALISEAGVQLQPAYVMPGPINQMPEVGDYQVEVLDAQGQVISTTPVRAYQAELEVEDEPHLFGINAMIPLPEQPAASFRLVKDGKVLAHQSLTGERSAPAVNSAPMAKGQRLQWSASGQPALVRYSKDGGKTWTTAGLDVTGGELVLQSALPAEGVEYQVISSGVWK